MNIKVGDKVRIKTEEELLAEGFVKEGDGLRCWQTGRFFSNEMRDYCGQIVTIAKIWKGITASDFNIEEDDWLWNFDETMIVDVCQPAPQTLAEYICNLPLEERAKLFVHCETYGYTSNFIKDYYGSYDEALQATIEALKQPKE